MIVSNLNWQRGSPVVFWGFGDRSIEKSYPAAIQSASVLNDGSGVAIVEPMETSGPRNAAVFSSDGDLRFHVELPLRTSQVQGFCDMYYVKDELTAILVTPGRDFAVVVDEVTGNYIRFYETR